MPRLAVGVYIEQTLVQVLDGFSCNVGSVTFLRAVDVVRVIAGDAASKECTMTSVESHCQTFSAQLTIVSREGVRGLPAGVKSHSMSQLLQPLLIQLSVRRLQHTHATLTKCRTKISAC